MIPIQQSPSPSKIVICVGAAKAGTSSLHSLLEQHPDIAVTSPKETDFFIRSNCLEVGRDVYLEKYYPQDTLAKVYFESDPIYMYQDGAMENIAALFPDAFIVVMLRNPVKRAFSQYLYRMSYGRYSETFEEMCDKEFERVAQGGQAKLEFGCLDRSMYAQQVRKILSLFPKEKVHFILFEEFIKNQTAAANQLFEWLGIEEYELRDVVENEGGQSRSLAFARLLFHNKYRNLRKFLGQLFPTTFRRSVYRFLMSANRKSYQNGEKPRLSPETQNILMQVFEKDMAELEQMTGLNLGVWKP